MSILSAKVLKNTPKTNDKGATNYLLQLALTKSTELGDFTKLVWLWSNRDLAVDKVFNINQDDWTFTEMENVNGTFTQMKSKL